jgi:hypothetical protein
LIMLPASMSSSSTCALLLRVVFEVAFFVAIPYLL